VSIPAFSAFLRAYLPKALISRHSAALAHLFTAAYTIFSMILGSLKTPSVFRGRYFDFN